MSLGQRLVTWSATLAVVLIVAVFGWRQASPSDEIQVRLREPSLALPDQAKLLLPGSDGGPILLVVIENTPEARPQAGLADACLVFAMPTEARITRFMAAHCHTRPTVIGPIRSARRYMLEIAADLGAILVHAGQSVEAYDMIAARRLRVLNEFWTPAPFWRDETRQAPHNLYTGLARLLAALPKRQAQAITRDVPYRFAEDSADRMERGGPAASLSLDYGAPYAVRYRYDVARKRYVREQNGAVHVDTNGRTISTATVLTMFVPWRDILVNGQPSSKIDLYGRGRLVTASLGRAVEGSWERAGGGPLALNGGQGRPIVLPPGPVWIELFPTDRPFYIGADAAR